MERRLLQNLNKIITKHLKTEYYEKMELIQFNDTGFINAYKLRGSGNNF